MPPKLKTRRKVTESVSEMDAWQCKTCNKTYGNIDNKVMEGDKCHEKLCTTCINMPDQVYDYMCQLEARSEAFTREKEKSLEVKTNPKKFWRYVRQKTTIREAIPALIKPNCMLSDTDDERAERLSNFFASIFTDEPPGNWEISPPPTSSIDDNLELTMNDIREELNRLDTSKSPGRDGIHPRVLFELREFILKPLLIIFQTSWETSKLHED